MNGYKVGDMVRANRQVTKQDLKYMYIMCGDDTLNKINTQCHKVLDVGAGIVKLGIDIFANWYPQDYFVKVEEPESEYTIESLVEPLERLAKTMQQLSGQMNQISEIMNEYKKNKEKTK